MNYIGKLIHDIEEREYEEREARRHLSEALHELHWFEEHGAKHVTVACMLRHLHRVRNDLGGKR